MYIIVCIILFKDKWIGLLHHICNKHQWLEGHCDHADGEHDENLSWFDRWDKDYQELQKIILNPELLASFKYYTRFRYRKIVDNHLLYYDKFIDKSNVIYRHTGGIECANSLGLVYTPKRTPFR